MALTLADTTWRPLVTRAARRPDLRRAGARRFDGRPSDPVARVSGSAVL